MKKLFISILCSIVFMTSNGQVLSSFGIKNGLSIANQTFRYPYSSNANNYRTGIYSALTFEFFRTKYLSFVSDLGYCQKGNKQTIEVTTASNPEGTGQYSTIDSRFDYLTFSSIPRIRYGINKFEPYVFFGPRIEYYIGYSSQLNYGSTFESRINKFVFGLNYGIGLEYKLSKIGICMEGQHHLDLTDFINSASTQISSISNTAFIISLGVKYYIDQK